MRSLHRHLHTQACLDQGEEEHSLMQLDDLCAGGFVPFGAAANRRGQRGHFCARVIGQALHHHVDLVRIDFRFVSLDVD